MNGLIGRIGKSGLALIAALVADVSATITVLSNPSIGALLRENVTAVICGAGILLAIALALGDRLFRKKEEVRSLRSHLSRLEDDLKEVDSRDRRNFESLLDELSFESGPIRFLNRDFLVTSWKRRDIFLISRFVDSKEELIFDNGEVHDAFQDLLSKMREFLGWSSVNCEVHPLTDLSGDLLETEYRIYFDRPGGYREYDQVVADGERLASEVIECRRSFEKVGRNSGL